jgi:oxygen-independent coproporphyrinogen-3 oxidase
LSVLDDSFAVYVHWPFCAQKCPYCDFNSHVRHEGWDEARYLRAYRGELAWAAERSGPRTVTSVFFGGGTPSLMQPDTVAGLIAEIGALWKLAPDAEITLEANPNSVDADRFAGYRQAGVNRVSIGVQSLDPEQLRALGRIHSVAEARRALAIARATFDRVSFDLIYARPRQEPAAWRAELAAALELAAGHLSLYQLTIEPDTPYAALHARGKLVVPDADAAAALYEITAEMTDAAGLPAYEISNYARPGEESRHNLTYWRYGAYAGVGPGAHGRLEAGGVRRATRTERNPEAWLRRVETGGDGLVEDIALSAPEMCDEALLMGLRVREGLPLARLAALGGVAPAPAAIGELEALGLLLRPAPGRIAATPRGRFVLDELVLRLSRSFVPVEAVTAS